MNLQQLNSDKLKKLKSELNETLTRLQCNQLVTEYEVLESDECIGVEDGKLYIVIHHGTEIFDNQEYQAICSTASIDSCDYNEENMKYETQIVT